jgi:DNA polymerase-3 subunit epsilon
LTTDEVESLAGLASEWGLGSSVIFAIHRSYFAGLARAVLADGLLTDLEREDLLVMAGLLGVPDAVNDLRAAALVSVLTVNRASELCGKTICFTGESVCMIDGVPLDRDRQQELAAAAGLVPVDAVTKHLDILVLGDASSMSGKAKKAEAYGIRKISERAFWAALGVRVDGC